MREDRLIHDRWLWAASALAWLLRSARLLEGRAAPCVADECTYRRLADRILAGAGLTESHEWLAAPAFPYLLAASKGLTGSFFAALMLQLVLALASLWLVAGLARQVAGLRAARIAAFGFALHPTLAFFTGRLWSESVYVFLLLAAVRALLWSREGGWPRAWLPGALVGACVLVRGVALLSLPAFAAAALWPGPGRRFSAAAAPWGHAAALVAVAVASVAPYSFYASLRHGGFVISDATLGRMMWLGNNEFEPISFDLMRPGDRGEGSAPARPRCAPELGTVAWNDCEVRAGLAWIRAHPEEFARRVPLRLAQLMNPNSFLTRHVRRGHLDGLSPVAAELLVMAVIASSLLVAIGGTLGVFARAEGPLGALAVGIAVGQLAAVAALAGLTRYRLPLESLWLVYAAALAAAPRVSWDRLRASQARSAGCALALAALLPLLLHYLPAAYGWGPPPTFPERYID